MCVPPTRSCTGFIDWHDGALSDAIHARCLARAFLPPSPPPPSSPPPSPLPSPPPPSPHSTCARLHTRLAHPSAPSTHPSARISARPSALQERLVRNVVVRTPGRAVSLEGVRAATAAAAQDHLASTSPLSDIEDAIPLPAASGLSLATASTRPTHRALPQHQARALRPHGVRMAWSRGKRTIVRFTTCTEDMGQTPDGDACVEHASQLEP